MGLLGSPCLQSALVALRRQPRPETGGSSRLSAQDTRSAVGTARHQERTTPRPGSACGLRLARTVGKQFRPLLHACRLCYNGAQLKADTENHFEVQSRQIQEVLWQRPLEVGQALVDVGKAEEAIVGMIEAGLSVEDVLGSLMMAGVIEPAHRRLSWTARLGQLTAGRRLAYRLRRDDASSIYE